MPDPQPWEQVKQTAQFKCQHCARVFSRAYLTVSGSLHCKGCDDVTEMPQALYYATAADAARAADQAEIAETFHSSSTSPEFDAWWSTFGAALVTRLNAEQLALAAFCSGQSRPDSPSSDQAEIARLRRAVNACRLLAQKWRDERDGYIGSSSRFNCALQLEAALAPSSPASQEPAPASKSLAGHISGLGLDDDEL